MLGPEMVNAIMDQQVTYIKQNKGKFLKSNGPIPVILPEPDQLVLEFQTT